MHHECLMQLNENAFAVYSKFVFYMQFFFSFCCKWKRNEMTANSMVWLAVVAIVNVIICSLQNLHTHWHPNCHVYQIENRSCIQFAAYTSNSKCILHINSMLLLLLLLNRSWIMNNIYFVSIYFLWAIFSTPFFSILFASDECYVYNQLFRGKDIVLQ